METLLKRPLSCRTNGLAGQRTKRDTQARVVVLIHAQVCSLPANPHVLQAAVLTAFLSPWWLLERGSIPFTGFFISDNKRV